MNPAGVERQMEMHGAIEPAEPDIIRRVTRSEDPLRDELLWGIPNEVTLEHIATTLPRRAYEEVAKVNPDWERVLQGRQVYDARVRSQKTQRFFLASCTFSTPLHYVVGSKIESKSTLSLFSPSEGWWYKSPPIPGCHEGMLHNCSSVLFDGSIYLLGGTRSRKDRDIPSAEVLVMNLAGYPWEWRRCANMQAPRLKPNSRVMHGKIFVFGGVAGSGDFHFEARNEVYDPEVDAWSFIAPTMPSASVVNVFSVGQQFACIGRMSRPRELKQRPVSHGEAELYRDTKFVVKVGDRGPKLICTRDLDAEDDMDLLHTIIESQLVGFPDYYSFPKHRHWARAKSLASSSAKSLASRIEYEIRRHEQHDRQHGTSSFFGLYDPVNDEWRELQMESLRESLETDNMDNADYDGPQKSFLGLQPTALKIELIRRDQNFPERYNNAMARLWVINL